jgi:ATP-binding cassette, subfamily B (MDR/TAP), member 6
VILLLFFTMNFISQNVALINLNGDDWWFHMKTRRDNIEMGLFITRYISTLLCFLLGLKAPGILSIENEDETVLIDNDNQNIVSS